MKASKETAQNVNLEEEPKYLCYKSLRFGEITEEQLRGIEKIFGENPYRSIVRLKLERKEMHDTSRNRTEGESATTPPKKHGLKGLSGLVRRLIHR